MLASRWMNIDVHRPLPAVTAPRLAAWLLVAFATLLAQPALGADPIAEKQARELQKAAIEEDNLNVDFPAAIKKLATAISRCGADKCDASLRGALYRDLGAMLVLSGSLDDARAAFAKALTFDSSLELDPAYKNPVIEGLWNDARKKAAAAAKGAEIEFVHKPFAAQLVRTPLPIYVESPGAEKLQRVVVKYRGAGTTEWKSVELRKMGKGYGGLIPCADVAEGTIQYQIQGYGTSDNPIAGSGTRGKPHSVSIKRELTGPAPSLPGQEAPKQCAPGGGTGECPPDSPGCRAPRKAVGEDCNSDPECEKGACVVGKCVDKKPEGEACQKDDECAGGLCRDSKCAARKKQGDEPCGTGDECASGTCTDGKCTAVAAEVSGTPMQHRIWVGIALSLDVVLLPTARDVCVLNSDLKSAVNGAGYRCVDQTTSANFPPDAQTNADIARSTGDSVGTGGFVPGNLRILASADYALNPNMLVGARAGFVLFTDPASNPGPAFPPLHLEARFTYLFGDDALSSTFAPMVLVAAGASEFDAHIGVPLRMMSTGKSVNEDAWLTAGPLFAAAGGGARWLVGPRAAITAAIKFQAAFGGSAGGIFGGLAPEIGAQFGL
jgi:hypothetical protein